MSAELAGLSGQQRNRAIASILGECERSEWWGQLEPREQEEFKIMIKNKIGGFHDFCLDIIKVSTENSIINDEIISMIKSIYRNVQR